MPVPKQYVHNSSSCVQTSLAAFQAFSSSREYFFSHESFSLKFTASKFLIHVSMKHSFQFQIFIQFRLQELVLQLYKGHISFFEVLCFEKFFSLYYIKLLSLLAAQWDRKLWAMEVPLDPSPGFRQFLLLI